MAITVAWAAFQVTQMLGACTAFAGTTLYGIDGGGNLIRINKTSGTGTLIGNSGFQANAAASDSQNRIFTAGGCCNGANQLVLIDPATASGSVYLKLNRPVGFGIRGMAFDSEDNLFVALSRADTSKEDLLATVDTTGAVSVIGNTGLTGLQALAFDHSDLRPRKRSPCSRSNSLSNCNPTFRPWPTNKRDATSSGQIATTRKSRRACDHSGGRR